MILRGIALMVLFLSLSACAVIDVNMSAYYKAPRPDCLVQVADQRANPELIQGNATSYLVNPSVKELLRSKLCGSEIVSGWAVAGKGAMVTINNLDISSYGFVGSDQMLTLVGSVRLGGADRRIQAYGTVESGVLPATRWPIILNSAMDNFVKQVEETMSDRN